MPNESEGPFNPSDMTDEELRNLIVQQLDEQPGLEAGWIEVEVAGGSVSLNGSVGTDGEKQVAETVVADVVGVENYRNLLVVNQLHREELPEAVDDSLAARGEGDDRLGEERRPQSDTAAHLQEDPEAEAFGTRDMQRAIQEGATYVPPDRPMPEGYGSEENH